MSCYSIPAMSMENEFANLTWLGKYVDNLVNSTGDQDYATAYEWGDEGPGNWPPLAVLFRRDGQWIRKGVLVSIMQKPDGTCHFDWEVAESEAVNAH